LVPNRLKEVRESRLISISELARKAEISPLTITRVERGESCRQQTKRKILAALGLDPLQKDRIFPQN
jgi:transcriptional regulator with XRE-family HTH domain